MCFFFFSVFATGFLWVALAVLERAQSTRLAWNSETRLPLPLGELGVKACTTTPGSFHPRARRQKHGHLCDSLARQPGLAGR